MGFIPKVLQIARSYKHKNSLLPHKKQKIILIKKKEIYFLQKFLQVIKPLCF